VNTNSIVLSRSRYVNTVSDDDLRVR